VSMNDTIRFCGGRALKRPPFSSVVSPGRFPMSRLV
jgi:hypothetical protein